MTRSYSAEDVAAVMARLLREKHGGPTAAIEFLRERIRIYHEDNVFRQISLDAIAILERERAS